MCKNLCICNNLCFLVICTNINECKQEMATNKAFEPDYNEETSRGIALTPRSAPTDIESRRISNESSAFNNNEPLDTYFADEKIHIPERVRKQINLIHSSHSQFVWRTIFVNENLDIYFPNSKLENSTIEWIQFSYIMGLHRTRFLDVSLFDWTWTSFKFFDYFQSLIWKKNRFILNTSNRSIALIDPGSIENDLKSGTTAKYRLLWLLLVSTILSFVLQRLSAR